jgi:hypothetical protein
VSHQRQGAAVARRVVLGALGLVPVAALASGVLVSALLPLHRLAFELLAPEFRLLALEAGLQGGHRVLEAHVTIADLTVVGQTIIRPDPRGIATASTPLAHALHLCAVAVLLAAIWPSAGLVRSSLRVLVAAMLSALVAPFDLPAILAGNVWRMLLDVHAPGAFSPLLMWTDFLSGGGRWLLGILIGATSVALLPDPAHVAAARVPPRAMPRGLRRGRPRRSTRMSPR